MQDLLVIKTPGEMEREALSKAFEKCGDHTRSMYFPHGYTCKDARLICYNEGTDVEYLVVLINKDVAAFGFIRNSKESFGMAVVDEYQRKGIGSIFVGFMIYYAKLNGFKKLATEGGTFMESHLKDILLKRGFTKVGEFLTRGKNTLMMEVQL